MTKLILIPAAQTDWRIQNRVAGDTDLPLNEYGHRQAVTLGQEVASLTPAAIRSGPEQASKQTASIIAHETKLRLRTVKELREMGLGHWQGLMVDDLEERFGRVYRQWRSDPLSIEPPEGETILIAADRLTAALEKIRKKHADETIAVVVGQYAYAVIRCKLIDGSFERFWNHVDEPQSIITIDLLDLKVKSQGPPLL